MYDYTQDQKPDCIITKRATHISGYAQVNINNHVNYEHRIIYAKTRGLVLADIRGKVIRHKCDCRACINPDHLEIGTLADNAADTKDRGRARGLSRPGALNPAARITQEVADAIRADRLLSYSELAAKYGTSKSNVSRIKNSLSWIKEN